MQNYFISTSLKLTLHCIVWISYGRVQFSDKSILFVVNTDLTVSILISIDLST